MTEWNYFEYTMFDESLDNILLSELNTFSRKGNLIRGGTDVTMRMSGAMGRAAGGFVGKNIERVKSGELAAHLQKRAGTVTKAIASGDFWKRMIQMIKEMWGKFRNVISSIFKSDENFINNELYNVRTILRNAVDSNTLKTGESDITVKLYPYWLGHPHISKLDIPRLNVNDENMLNALNNGTFMSTYIKGVDNIPYNDGNFTEALNTKFRGGPAEITMDLNTLNKTIDNIIRVCKDNTRIVRQLERSSSNLTAAANDALRLINASHGADNTKLLMAIQQYQSLGNKVLACAKGVVSEGLRACINVCKKIMRSLRAAGGNEVENERLRDETNGVNDAKSKGFFGSGKDLDRAIPSRIQVTQDTLNTLGNDPNKIAKKINALMKERDNLKAFITKRKIPIKGNNPKYQIIHQRVQDYNRQISLLNTRKKQLESQNN